MIRIKYYLCLLFIILKLSLFAQEYGYKHYTIQDGLVQSQVCKIFQDSRGFIWIGTKGGASRFDGISFVNFTTKDGLFNNIILFFTEDHKGVVWLATVEGLVSIDGNKVTAYPTEHFRKYRGLFAVYEEEADKLIIVYVNEKNQVVFTQFSKGNYTDITTLFPAIDLEYPDAPAYEGIYDIENQTFWLAARPYGLYKISGGKTERLQIDIHDLRGLTKGSDNKLYMIANDSAFIIANDSLSYLFSDINLCNKYILKTFAIDKEGKVYFYDTPPGQLNIFNKNEIISDHFDFKSIAALFIDREDNLWVGTESGLYRRYSDAFINFIPGKCGIGNLIWSIAEDKFHRMWFSAYDEGLHYLADGQFYNGIGYQQFTGKKYCKYYMGSLIDHDQNILFPIAGIGGLKYDGLGFSQIFIDIPDITTLFFYEDPDNYNLYAGTNIGLYRISKKDGVQNLNIRPGNGKSRMVVSIIKDKLNRFWFGGFNGITILQGEKKIHLPTKEFPFKKGANAMLLDTRQQLWIGNAEGLFTYDYREFKQISHPGFNSMVTSLALVGDSALLIGTINGLAMLDLKTYYNTNTISVNLFGKHNGFEGIEVGQNAIFKDSKGLYWIATSDRVVQFNPALVKKNSIPPATYISGVSILNDQMEWIMVNDSLTESNHFHFSNNQKNLRFDFIGISTSVPELVKFSYQLEGYDKGWSEPGLERYAVYTNLPPGEYRLLLKACNAEGIWTTEATSVSFHIVPALYQRTWFWILFLFLAAGLLVFSGVSISNRRKQQQQQKLEAEKRMAQLQLLTLKNQIDPHFTFNAINSIASAVLKENKELAYKYFVKLSRLMRSILGSSENLICSLSDELEFVKDYLDINKFRFKDKFDYKIIVAPEVDLNLPIPKMAIQSFSENALKHGILHLDTGGLLIISIFSNNGDLKLVVEDNGIGREMAAKISETSTGKGLIILKGYFDYFNKYNQRKVNWSIIDLYDVNGLANGTRVEVNIPAGFNYDEQ